MNSIKSHFVGRILIGFLLAFPLALVVAAQDDVDPNSPTPVLLSEANSTRALAVESGGRRLANPAKVQSRAFSSGARINLYATVMELASDEGANALRIYATDKTGKIYRFPVVDVQQLKGQDWIYAVTIELSDEIGYWEPPAADGDVLLRLTWRGLSSNQVRLGLGKTGGKIREEIGAAPTPYKDYATRPAKTPPIENFVGDRWSGDRMRFLEQATFGPTPALDARIRRIGLRTWLAEQFDATYPSVGNPYPNIPLKSSDAQNATTGCGMFQFTPTTSLEYRICIRDHYNMYPLQTWFFKEAFYGDAQLRHRVAWALSQILVTSGVDIQQSSHMI